MLRYKTHGCRHRYGPEPTDHYPDERAPDHEHFIVRCDRHGHARKGHQCRQGKQQQLTVPLSREIRDKEARDDGESAGDRDRMSGRSFADAQFIRDRRQQAERHEFRRDQGENAERHRQHTAPICGSGSGFPCGNCSFYGHGTAAFLDYFFNGLPLLMGGSEVNISHEASCN
ncbi:hypothetical protein D3C87_1231030 [compost metagenome]